MRHLCPNFELETVLTYNSTVMEASPVVPEEHLKYETETDHVSQKDVEADSLVTFLKVEVNNIEEVH